MKVALIDYGAGNLTSVRKGLRAAGAEVDTPPSPDALGNARAIVVPGVGNFAATSSLDAEWREAIHACVGRGAALLGICLGMQWLFEGSDEAPDVAGLGLIPGRCTRIAAERPLKVPHVGWNALRVTDGTGLLAGVLDGTQVYFTHSFAAPVTPSTSATCAHGGTFAAVVQKDRVGGVQFHPEKSGDAGITILRNFLDMVRD